MHSCLDELREAFQDLSRRRAKLANSPLVQNVMALVARAQGCMFEILHLQLLPKLQPRPVDHVLQYESSDGLKNCIQLNPLFILADYDLMWIIENV